MSVKCMGLGGREWADQGPGMSVKYTGLGGREWAKRGPRMSVKYRVHSDVSPLLWMVHPYQHESSVNCRI